MKTRSALLGIAVVLLIGVSGCSGSETGGHPAQGTRPTDSTRAVPFNLYTHCGIEWAKIRGTYWRAEKALSDRSGNPPEGWGNPYQAGQLSFQSSRMATFSSPAGLVIFHRTSRPKPPFMCS